MPRSSGSRPKKRKGFFQKNNTFASKIRVREVSATTLDLDSEPSTLSQTPGPSPSPRSSSSNDQNIQKPTPSNSRSKQKLEGLYGDANSSDESDLDLDKESYNCDDQSESGYRIIDLGLLKTQVRLDLVCRHCHCASELVEEKRSGLGSLFRFQCTNKKCSVAEPFFSDQPIKAKEKSGLLNHSINRRVALAMRYIGCGLSALRTFCGIMNLPPPVAKPSYDKIKTSINEAAVSVQLESMKEAARIEYSLAENLDLDEEDNIKAPRDIDVSVDGTYMSRGYSSKVGVVTAIGCVTGKVLDTSVKSKSCKSCDYWSKRKDSEPVKYTKWLETHPPSCEATHEGSSGSMEALSGVDIFSRSIETNNLRYTRYIGDGDTNSFKAVLDSKPYQDKDVVKVECVGHVQKRMGTRLRKLKSSYSGKKLRDGKGIGGVGRLTDKQIDQIQSYFGNAIRDNKNDIRSMREAIWAIYFHKLSTNSNPRHQLCNIKWCKYKQAESNPDKNLLKYFNHKNNLPEPVLEVIKPVFKDLTHPDLLNKCLDGYTQNANESINQKIWKICPKNQYHGAKTVRTAVALATITFNDGMKSFSKIFDHLGIYAEQHLSA